MTKLRIKNAWTVAKLNFINLKIAYFVPLAILLFVVLLSTLNVIVGYEFMTESVVLYANLSILLVVIISIFLINFRNNNRILRLNAKKSDLFIGIAINYLIMITVASIFIVAIYYLSLPLRMNGKLLSSPISEYFDIYFILGFNSNGFIVGFIQLFCFLLFACSSLHVIIGMQERWYGQVVLGLIAVLILLLKFVWHSFLDQDLPKLTSAIPLAWKIIITLVSGIALYSAYLLVLKRKRL